MRTRISIIVAVLALGCLAPAMAAAVTSTATPAKPAASVEATHPYELDFTLPTAGKSGCLVCHGDPNLVRPSGNSTMTLFVSVEVLQGSAHKDVVCTACHLDFAYKVPHPNVKTGGDAWRSVAKQSCNSPGCHEKEFGQIISGAHSPVGKPGQDPKIIAAARIAEGKPAEVPLCGDCHGSHQIGLMDDAAIDAAVHRAGIDTCGRCHEAEADSYTDPYHGAAYRRGALDAPACWDCHEAHEVHATDDALSPVNEKKIAKTCGKCHENVTADYVTYAKMIHRRADIESGIPMYAWLNTAQGALRQAVLTVKSWF